MTPSYRKTEKEETTFHIYYEKGCDTHRGHMLRRHGFITNIFKGKVMRGDSREEDSDNPASATSNS